MEEARFERQYRTTHSEGYLIFEGGDRLGRLDLHYTPTVVYATLVVERELDEDDILDLIEQADDELVLTADVPREDFVVQVYQGRDLGTYSDEYFEEEDETEENGS
ncbi:MAG TPA: hypothetical protein VFZ25_12040 [Chloroflexota bacterium]|nr:hypothetical protein [Chloroflexota bacterium]